MKVFKKKYTSIKFKKINKHENKTFLVFRKFFGTLAKSVEFG